MNLKTGNELTAEAFEAFGEWCDKYREEHPDDEKDAYELALTCGQEKPLDHSCLLIKFLMWILKQWDKYGKAQGGETTDSNKYYPSQIVPITPQGTNSTMFTECCNTAINSQRCCPGGDDRHLI
ncbi:MAG: hypothetical protein CMB80_03040 [Flammeovirgaceae bacterium]|nr:hypothetical protein [Flammeovirgaceae bacterium]|tara:strand:+ start:757 stop:1128 length:372 start_codon:yes stop_codon:yes gene_type:complete